MPKMKTNKAAAKRYSYTSKGKVKRTTANSRHRLATKTSRQKMSRRVNSYVDDTNKGGIKKLLPYG
jgi:large subunit ribosomal protein L35